MATSIPSELITAYQQTNYVVKLDNYGLILRIGEYSEPLDELHTRYGVRSSAFITACNPHSEIYTLEQNASRQNQLKADLESIDCVVISGTGKDPDGKWPREPSFLAIGITREDTEKLGNNYGQFAVVYSAEDAIPGLIFLK